MDQSQARALSALQPFIHLALTTKTPSPRFLADLIGRATSAPGTYIFTSLLQLPVIQSLASTEFKSHLVLLEIVSYGTYSEYLATQDLPPLSDAQEEKLKQLSLLSLASPNSTTSLTYKSLMQALSLPTASALESLVTSSIYTSLLAASLSPTSNPPTVNITSVAPLRDLRPNSLASMLRILKTWEKRCDSVIGELENEIEKIKYHAQMRNIVEKNRADVVDAAVLNTVVPEKTDFSSILDGTHPTLAGLGSSMMSRAAVAAAGGAGNTNRGGGGQFKSGPATLLGNKRDLEEREQGEQAREWEEPAIDDGVGGGSGEYLADNAEEGTAPGGVGGAGAGGRGGRSSKRVQGSR